MGTKQLLLIALGVIIASLAVVVGVDFFTAQAQQSNRDSVILDLQHIASSAQAYYKREAESGGGGKSFIGFEISKNLESNSNGDYKTLYVMDSRTLISGTGKEYSGNAISCTGSKLKITYQILVRPDKLSIRKVH